MVKGILKFKNYFIIIVENLVEWVWEVIYLGLYLDVFYFFFSKCNCFLNFRVLI